jgi:hypothetical protein
MGDIRFSGNSWVITDFQDIHCTIISNHEPPATSSGSAAATFNRRPSYYLGRHYDTGPLSAAPCDPFFTFRRSTAQHRTVQHSTAQYSTAPHRAVDGIYTFQHPGTRSAPIPASRSRSRMNLTYRPPPARGSPTRQVGRSGRAGFTDARLGPGQRAGPGYLWQAPAPGFRCRLCFAPASCLRTRLRRRRRRRLGLMVRPRRGGSGAAAGYRHVQPPQGVGARLSADIGYEATGRTTDVA